MECPKCKARMNLTSFMEGEGWLCPNCKHKKIDEFATKLFNMNKKMDEEVSKSKDPKM